MPQDDTETFLPGPDPDKLDRYHRQQLSAMLDGELSPDQARFMLRRLQHDSTLGDCWERWQVCGDVLRGQRNALLPPDFAQGVARAIADQQVAGQVASPVSGRAPGAPRLWRWGGGAALAASVAMVALFVGRQPELASGPALPDVATVSPADAATPADTTATPAPGGVPAEAAVMLAGSALAVAELPRRTDERRSRGQHQRAAVSRVQRQVIEAPVAMTVAAPLAASVAPAGPSALAELALPTAPRFAGTDPFAALPDAASRPWPRAVLPGAGQAHTVGYDLSAAVVPAASSFSWLDAAPAVEAAGVPAGDAATAPQTDGGPD